MNLGEKLRLARREAGFSQRQLCGDRITRNMLTGEESAVLLPKSNVVTLVLGEKGSVIVRPSGTEPKVKLYLTAVDRDKDRARALLADLAAAMNAYVPK